MFSDSELDPTAGVPVVHKDAPGIRKYHAQEYMKPFLSFSSVNISDFCKNSQHQQQVTGPQCNPQPKIIKWNSHTGQAEGPSATSLILSQALHKTRCLGGNIRIK